MALILFLVSLAMMLIPQAYADDIDISSFTSDPVSPTDSTGMQDVTLRCQVNLPAADITSVSITGPNSFMVTITSPSSGSLYETTLSDVHRSDTGTYTCQASSTTSSVTSDYSLTVVCAADFYGGLCTMSCNCVTGGSCNQDSGVCTCTAAFTGAVCDRDNLDIIHVTSDPLAPTDSSSVDNVKLRCRANLPDANIMSVTMTYPGTSVNTVTHTSNGWYEVTVTDVHPSNSGIYTCTVTPTGSLMSTQDTYQLTITDINECDITSPAYPCSSNAVCDNTDGGFTCTCYAGFSGSGTACTVCMTDYYGDQCMSRCTCVSSGNPMCNNVDGLCTCNKLFDGATCNKANLAVSSFEPMSGDATVRDDASVNDVVMQCRVNLAESDLSSSVAITILSSASTIAMTKVQEGLWKYTIEDVHPIDSGGYTCTATARATTVGVIYTDDRMYNLVVEDVDECQENTDNCHQYAACTNDAVDGGFDCTCFNGFSGNGVQCTDINECATSMDNCHGDATCKNTVGSFSCTCNVGFTGDGTACTACVQGKYGSNCAEYCTCVMPIMPGQNDVTCSNVDGTCTCDNNEFTGKTCDKKNLDVTLVSDPNPVLDTTAMDTITWQCRVNLHSRDLALPVRITYPSSGSVAMLMNGEGLYEMTLYDVMPTNNGIYTCSASASGMQPVTGIFDLEVLVVGRIISVSDPVEGEVGGTVQITCTVYTIAGTSISWFMGSNDDNPIANSTKYRITETKDGAFEQISYLDVSDLMPNDNGTYLCKAQNTGLGSLDTKEVEIIIIEKPVIGGFRLSALKSDEILAEWGITFDGNLPPPDCTVEYRTMNGAWIPSAGSPVTDVTHTLTGLIPYTDYNVRVHCSNKVGMSNTIQGGPQTTLQSNPSKPLNLNAVNKQPDSFVVNWDEPAVKNGPISKYLVKVTNTDGGVIKQSEETQLSSQIDSLRPYMDYIVVVTAVNTEFGQDLVGTPSDTLTVRTEQDAPSQPVNVLLHNEGDTCVVTWDPPEEENGIIVSYTIFLEAYMYSIPGSEDGETPVLDPSKSSSVPFPDVDLRTYSVQKSELPPYAQFRFEILATTAAGDGPRSEETDITCNSPRAVPDAIQPPVLPDVTGNTVTESTFKMRLAPVSQTNGPISCLEVTVVRLNDDDVIEGKDPDFLYHPDLHRSFDEAQLLAGLPYVALVFRGSELTGFKDVEIGSGGETFCGSSETARKLRQTPPDHFGVNGPLKPNTKYTAFVRAYVVLDNGMEDYVTSPLLQPVWTTAETGNTETGNTNTVVIVVVVVVVVIVISAVLIIVVIVCCMRLRKRRQAKQTRSTSRTIVEMDEVDYEMPGIPQGVAPTVYDDVGLPSWALRWEIIWKNLVVDDNVLGAGNFGEVRSGTVNIGGKMTKSAVKILKGHALEADRDDFMEEFRTMTNIGYHPNVVSLLGACQNEDVLYVALEYLPHGDLRSYLRTARAQSDSDEDALSSDQLVKFALDVAKGMKHLATSGVIHRDLAARNILVGQGLIAKVSDFGLSRGEDIYVQTSTRRVPTRWLAIESLTHRTYTTQSDVWSFGILLWEIASIGGTPYPAIETKSLAAQLMEGYRMAKPNNCDEEIYSLMLRCWEEEPDNRPSFGDLVSILGKMNDNTIEHTYMAINRKHYENFSVIRPELDDN